MYICTWFIMERHLDLHVMENKLGGVDESDTETRMYHSQGSGGGSTSGSTHTGSTSNPKRRKKRPIHGVKTVSVTRGKSGYGFTISGQHPCVLSCIVAGSPADEAGLKTGDYVMAVNNENVSKAPHDDVVRMVGMSTGTLTLQVAENYNSSDSSDDEYRHRKVRYPNRVRTRPPGMGTSGKRNGEKVLGESNQRNRHASSASGKIREGHTHRGWHDAGTKSCGAFPKHHNHTPVGEENSAPNSLNESKSPQLTGPLSIQHRGVSTVASVQATPIINYPLSRQAIVKRTTQSAQAVRHQPAGSHDRLNRPLNTSLTASSISAILKTSVNNTVNSTANNAFIALDDEDEDDDGDEESLMEGNFQDVKVVVGYIGSIEIPSDANKPHIKIQSIRNAVRRLRVEQKIHTLVLMDVSGDGVKLTNIMGTTVAHYPVDRIAFSGISPDDRRFFGIVTLHSFGSDDASSENGSQEDEPASSGSCHVFMVDPEMRAHNIHAQKARAFKINCSQHADRPGCAEFPKSATSIILAITNLYKDRPNLEGQNEVALSQAFADPSRAVQRSTSNSSNSDSGLGFGREDPSNDNVFVDMPPPVGRPPRHVHQALGAGMGPGHPGRHSGDDAGRVHPPHCSPDNRTIPTPIKNSRIKGQGHHDQSARLDVSNTSTAEESAFVRFSASGKYNIRAMPLSNQRPADADGLDAQNSADSLRASINKYFRGRHMTGDQSHSGGSDQESLKGGHSSRSDYKPNSSSPTGPQEDNNYSRPMSTPPQEQANFAFYQDEFCKVVDMDEDRLSPRAMLPPPFHQLRSPSAPPVLENSFDAEDMETSANTSVMGGLIERFEQDNALRISSPAEASRRFSLSDAVHTKKREKEKTTVDDASERWAKPHSVRHRKISRMQPPLSHSHESLVAIEQEASNQRLISANSANNITNHGIDEDEKKDELDDIGRIAGWAVSFEKLLKDKNGLAVFTEFLKKEFSEENIVFWRICEQYKGILDADRRKTKAKEIFSKHISTKAADPVNIDHITRQAVEKQLDNPMSNTFEKPQLEIYRLMKQDSYQRFLKSDLYKKYMMREIEGKPLDLPKDEFQGILGSKELKEEKKKAAKNKETEDKEKRRRSLLPWRQRSSKQSLKATSDSDLKKSKDKNVVSVVSANAKEREVNNNTAAVAASLKKASGIDLSTIRKEVQANSKEQQSASDSEEHFKFCRVTLPDGSTTVVCAKPGQDIRAVLGKLCEKRGLSIASVDVFLLGSDKPLDLSEDISTLGSQEVTIERRVLFRMDLPNKKSIGVKAKPNRSVRDVFKPILNKYGFKLDSIIVQLVGRQSDIDLDAQVSTIDNQRVVIKNQEDVTVNKTRKSATFKWQKIAVRHPRNFISMVTERTLDCDTQCIFDDILKGESQTPRNFDEFGILDMSRSQEQQKNSADRHSSGLFGHKKKEPQAEKQASQAKLKNKQKVTFNLQKNTSRRPPSYADDQFLDLLMKVSGRLDDQRGLDTQNCEIPDFLRNKPHPSGRESAPPIMVGGERSSLQRFMDSMSTSQEYVENDTGAFMAYTRHPLPNRPSSVSLDDMDHKQQSFTDRYTDFDHNVNHSDSFGTAQNSFNNSSQDFSFLMDGTTQSQEDNSDFFHSTLSESTDFDDPCLADKSETKDFSVNKYQSAKAWGYSRHRPYVQSPLNRSSTPDLDLTLTQSRTDLDGTVTNSPDTSSPFRSQSVPPVTDNGNVSLSPIGQNSPRFSQPSWQYSNGPSSSPRLHNSPKNLHHPGHSPSEAPRKFQNVQSVSMTTNEDCVLSNSSVRKYNVLKSSKAADCSLHIVSPRKNNPVVIDLDHPEENVTFV